ncbi:MAG TPA: saccharopine dehydrogenase NADP-binding domain-containing protein [Baekduia sp.]|nr:saccharopine dehydrogenase NADP-binding domain-containing protein [Baekduia sp.]
MRVAVLGAGGIIAPAIVRDLAESDEVTDLLLLDLSANRAAIVAERHGGAKARIAAVDARDGLAEHLQDIDILVNSASYRVNLTAMNACLQTATHYIDLGGLYHLTGDQLELDSRFREAGLLALLGMGSAPGKTNVMAARAVRALGAPPERIDVLAAGRDLDPPQGPSYPYSPRTLIDELTLSPIVIRDGIPVRLEAMHAGGSYEFPRPIGTAETMFTLHSEVRTFAESFGCRQCSFRLSLAPAVLALLRPLITASDAEIEAAAHAAVPASADSVSAHVIVAERDGKRVTVTALTHGIEAWGLGGGIISTAAPAAAAVRLMARGRIAATGALPPERCVDPDDLFAELELRGCTFEIKETSAT